MFDLLSEKLQATFADVRLRGTLSESDIDAAMREIRLALLDADVNFKVVKKFTADVKESCIGAGVLVSLKPGQQVTKIVGDELTALMGGAGRDLVFAPAGSGPTVILMAGLQGSGKTTASAKLARHLVAGGKSVALAACDVYRPAAVEQLVTVGARAGATVYQRGTDADPVEIAAWALDQAKAEGHDALIIDTAGRLHVDEQMMDELARIRKRVKPHNVLLVVDAMTGQDAVNVAESFAEAAEFDGVIVTKLDGDARGGAALSIKASPANRSSTPRRGRSWRSSSASTRTAWRAGSLAWETSSRSSRRSPRQPTPSARRSSRRRFAASSSGSTTSSPRSSSCARWGR